MSNNIFVNLEQEIRESTEKDYSVIRVQLLSSRSKFPVFLGVEPFKFCRLMLIGLEEQLGSKIFKNLPTWQGVEIGQEKLDIYGKNSWYLVIKQTESSDKEIFDTMISQVSEELLETERKDVIQDLCNVLERWRHFFLTYGSLSLSKQAQKGLFGELHFLKQLIGKFGTNSVNNWFGAEKKRHDFQFNNLAVEIKTTTSKKNYSITISSETQLDDEGLEGLYLYVLVFNEIENGSYTLPSIINEIRILLQEDLPSLRIFEQKLLYTGYLDSQSDKYITGFSERERLAYTVTDGFPRLIAENMPNGVGDLSYTVQLSSCEEFNISTELLHHELEVSIYA